MFRIISQTKKNATNAVQTAVQTRSLFHTVVRKKRFCFIEHCLDSKRQCFTLRAIMYPSFLLFVIRYRMVNPFVSIHH